MITIFDSKYHYDKLVLVMPCEIGNNDKLHKHNYFEAVYIIEGEAIHIINNNSTKVSEGDFFIIDYDIPHMFKVDDNQKLKIINVIFKPEMVDLSLKGCRSFNELCKNFFIRLNVIYSTTSYYYCKDNNEVIKNMIYKMLNEFRNNAIGKNELLRSNLVELIIESIRLSEANKPFTNYSTITNKIINSIEEEFMTNLTLSKIAKETNYSVSYLSRTFKKDTGMCFQKYLDNIRLKQSEFLLLKTNKKISEIINIVGFSDINRFHRLFKETYGSSPKQYRINIKELDFR